MLQEDLMYGLANDLRLTLRRFRKSPGFTLAIVLTLALGIGATTAIFSLVEGVLLRPLPFKDPDRLVVLGEHLGGRPGMSVRATEIATYTRATQAFSSLGGYITTSFELSGKQRPEEIDAARLNAAMFTTLGVQPVLGRVFNAADENARQQLAVISYSFWTDRFHRDPSVIGASLVLDRKPYQVIGVMPRNFEFPLSLGTLSGTQVWVPLSLTPDELSDEASGFFGYQMIARLKDGVSVQQGVQDADRVAHQIMSELPPTMSAIKLQGDVEPIRENTIADVRPILRTLFMAAFIALLVACVNVSGLLLVRAIRERREYAVRVAIGASSSHIIRESVVEGLLLSVLAGVLGLAFAAIAVRVALHYLPDSLPRVSSISINPLVAGFALVVAVATGVLCSLAPAFAALRTNLITTLKEGAQAGSTSHTWLRSALVVAEVAIALVLLTVSGMFLRSLQKMLAVNPGFRTDHALVAQYQLPLQQYPTDASVTTFNRAVIDRLSSKPGVSAVAISNAVAVSTAFPLSSYTIEGVSVDQWKLKFAAFTTVYGNYFDAMGIPLIDGRTFNAHDDAKSPLVVIVSQSMARDCWPGQSPLGKRMHIGNPRKGYPWETVVGVVADTKIPRDTPGNEQWYLPMEQPITGSKTLENLSGPSNGYITMRSALDPDHMIQTLRSTIAEIDPLLALQNVRPLDDAISEVEAPRHFNTTLITAFAVNALLLAIGGIYGVMAFSVSQRNREIAIRMTLGAQRANIAQMVLFSGGKLALIGCSLGVVASLAVSQLVASFLFGVSATDPFTYSAAVLLMLLLALLASAFPAMRAASSDPIKPLRST
jgi:putative ABC transport system permease protein